MTVEREAVVLLRIIALMIGAMLLILALTAGYVLREYLSAKQIVSTAVGFLAEPFPPLAGRLERSK
jgi:hypothetical protein